MSRLFIVTVASEKGGVGKTTIATNLAVYLKALHEDLPVTIASFDNHFSIDHMFALGRRPAAGMAELLGAELPPDLVALGQYGVQYIASSRRLETPAHSSSWLRSRLEALELDGILILDTRPILDWFTEGAILAADLVLTPVKDRAALVNAAALREVLQAAGRPERLWLVPSLVDARAKLNNEVKVSDFLTFAARERDYQVTALSISKSPRVEGLASGFSTRILPILTHARQTAVHAQLRQLAEFVLERRAAVAVEAPSVSLDLAALTGRRLVVECPVCNGRTLDGSGHVFFDLRSRRRGLLHAACFEELLEGCELTMLAGPDSLLLMELAGPGMIDVDAELQLHLFDAGDQLVASERVPDAAESPFLVPIEAMAGRRWQTTLREWLLIDGTVSPAAVLTSRAAQKKLAIRRQIALREAMGRPGRRRQSS